MLQNVVEIAADDDRVVAEAAQHLHRHRGRGAVDLDQVVAGIAEDAQPQNAGAGMRRDIVDVLVGGAQEAEGDVAVCHLDAVVAGSALDIDAIVVPRIAERIVRAVDPAVEIVDLDVHIWRAAGRVAAKDVVDVVALAAVQLGLEARARLVDVERIGTVAAADLRERGKQAGEFVFVVVDAGDDAGAERCE